MSLFTVQVGSDPAIEVYGGLPAADQYINAMIGDGAVAYRALVTATNTADRQRLLVAATRWVDSLAWQGAPDGYQSTTLQFPRSGLTSADGTAATDAQQLAIVNRAVFELVALLADDPDVLTEPDAGSNVQDLGAGSARVAFFRPTSAQDGNATVLPVVIDRLLGRWAASADPAVAAAAAGTVTGTNCHSDFDRCDELEVVTPL